MIKSQTVGQALNGRMFALWMLQTNWLAYLSLYIEYFLLLWKCVERSQRSFCGCRSSKGTYFSIVVNLFNSPFQLIMTTSLDANPEPPVATAQFDKAISSREFDEIVEAILQGKYSWACVLILRFAGHNPLHYLPYRTYTRLLKENRQDIKEKHKKGEVNQSMAIDLDQNSLESQPFAERSFTEFTEFTERTDLQFERFVDPYPPELFAVKK